MRERESSKVLCDTFRVRAYLSTHAACDDVGEELHGLLHPRAGLAEDARPHVLERPGAAGRVRVHYSAGLAAHWDGVPEALRQGIVRLAAFGYSERSAQAAVPAAVTALWRPWRRMVIA